MRATPILLCVAIATASAGVPAAEEADEAWIARYVASAQAPGVPPARGRAQASSLEQLPRLLGRRVLVALRDGSERRGIVQAADDASVVLRSGFDGAIARHTLMRADILSLQVD